MFLEKIRIFGRFSNKKKYYKKEDFRNEYRLDIQFLFLLKFMMMIKRDNTFEECDDSEFSYIV